MCNIRQTTRIWNKKNQTNTNQSLIMLIKWTTDETYFVSLICQIKVFYASIDEWNWMNMFPANIKLFLIVNFDVCVLFFLNSIESIIQVLCPVNIYAFVATFRFHNSQFNACVCGKKSRFNWICYIFHGPQQLTIIEIMRLFVGWRDDCEMKMCNCNFIGHFRLVCVCVCVHCHLNVMNEESRLLSSTHHGINWSST